MKRHLLEYIFALCLIAAFSLASCSRMEDIPDNAQEIQQPAEIAFTATLAPKGESPQSKAITSGKDSNGKDILNVAWAEGEQVAVYYQKTDNSYATATATVGTPNGDGSASITATLTDAKGGTAQFVYPATLANATGDIDETKLMTQYGRLNGIANSISEKFDAATGTGTITVSGSEASVSSTVTMTNCVCICKFHLTVYTVGANNTFTLLYQMNDDLTISDGNGHTYTIMSTKEWPDGISAPDAGNPGFGTDDDIYVAMLPITNKPLTLSATYKDKNYTLTTKPGTLAAGKFYRNVPVTMQLENLEITGDITQTLTVPDGMTVTVNDASFNVTSAPAIRLGDNSTLILKGTNTVSATYANAIQCDGNATIDFQSTTNTITAETAANKGIQIADGKSLNITGSGSAAVSGGIDLQSSASLKFNGQAASHDIYIPDATTLSAGGITVGSTITIADDASFTLSWTTLNVTSGPGIQCSGNATLILDGANSVTTTAEKLPAILPGGSGTTLTIQGSGSVNATGGQYAAGIGTGSKESGIYTCGNIIIESGTITAKGGESGAGIGGGNKGICGNITISGGTIKATGGSYGAGIGSGSGETARASTCGDIIISGGTVTATGGIAAAGIGSGQFGKFASINITDRIASVKATDRGISGSVPIGKGNNDMGSGSVTVDDVPNWSGTATTHLNFTQSTTTYINDTWILTHK